MLTALDLGEMVHPERIIGEYRGERDGPTLIALGAVHGNEREGIPAIRAVLEELARSRPPFRGRLLGLAGNLTAYHEGVRFLEADLNRIWRPDILYHGAGRDLAEYQDLVEIKRVLEACFADSDGPVSLIDFHSFSGEGEPFAVSPGNDRDMILLRDLPMPTVYGLDDLLEGTLAHWVHTLGHHAIGFEGGHSGGPTTAVNMEAFLWDELTLLGCLDARDVPMGPRLTWGALHARLRLPKAIRADYRHRILAGDTFCMLPGFASFDYVHKGLQLAEDRHGDIRVPHDGYLLMPLYQGQGEDGFFIGHVEPTGLL